ncbi:Pentatricopeptide repeat superfamily protein [Perilla frutescens var. hirtella]|uniref:Pentatricopeptide repeat superfamily protein n=1 Tax=Perilla frutescens var. hirtella TaxID=608512 RepID=A0AAD4JPC0_PERFH|nr:Pentatricopeptide repeat superfamily protein [Perilla frutescens var. hirtella]
MKKLVAGERNEPLMRTFLIVLYEWMDSSNLQFSNADEAVRIDLLGRAEGVASAEKYFDGLQEKTDKTYGALLSCYCRERVLDKALETFEKMNEMNYTSTLNYSNVLSLYSNLEQPSLLLHTVAAGRPPFTDPDFQFQISSIISRQKWSELRLITEPCTHVYFFDQLFRFNNFDSDLIISFFKWSQRKHKVDLAFEGFMRAGDYGFKLSVRSCNSMLAALVRGGRIGNVEFAYKEMVRRRIEADSTTFNTVVNGLCKAGRLNKASDIVEDMGVYGVTTSVVTYNTLIDGYCKRGGAGRMYKADALLKKMVEKGLSPSVITYNILIDGFCKDDNLAASLRLLKEMKEQGVRPSVITYNTLINGLCADGKIDEAMSLRDEMVGMGLEPNIVTHSVFINGYSKKKMLNEARELFDDIVSKGVAVNVMTFNTLINAYCRAGELGEAVAIFNLMLGKEVSPDVSTYNCLIGAYYRDGKMEAADKLLNEMEEKGLKADVVTYNIRIDAMCKSGETRKAVRFLDEMFKKGLHPSHITYNSLMDGYCKQGNLKAALTVKKRMEKEKKRQNVVTYNVLIKAFSESGKLEEANRYLNEMLEKGLVPNRITYDLIKEEMMEKGFVPDIDGHIYGNSGLLEGNYYPQIRDLGQSHLNYMIRIGGVVTRCTGVLPQLQQVKYDCNRCGAILGPFVKTAYAGVKVGSCSHCQSKGPFTVNIEQAIYRNCQKLTLQESFGIIPAGRLPRCTKVILLNNLVDCARRGEEMEVTGIYTKLLGMSLNTKKGFPVSVTLLEANYVAEKQDPFFSLQADPRRLRKLRSHALSTKKLDRGN